MGEEAKAYQFRNRRVAYAAWCRRGDRTWKRLGMFRTAGEAQRLGERLALGHEVRVTRADEQPPED
jgi:hypothetical protein